MAAVDALAAEKQVPRDKAARNDKVALGNKKRGLEGPRLFFLL
jgi:hypothetical protein